MNQNEKNGRAPGTKQNPGNCSNTWGKIITIRWKESSRIQDTWQHHLIIWFIRFGKSYHHFSWKNKRGSKGEKKTVYNRNVKNLTKKLFHCDKRIIAQVLTNGRNESRFNNLPNGDRREFKYTDAWMYKGALAGPESRKKHFDIRFCGGKRKSFTKDESKVSKWYSTKFSMLSFQFQNKFWSPPRA